jgi:chromosomal replication initiator protein
MKGATRNKAIILPRHLAMWEIKQQRPDMSFPAIGRWFGGRDHSSVCHAVSKINRMKESGELAWYFEAKEKMLLTCDYC